MTQDKFEIIELKEEITKELSDIAELFAKRAKLPDYNFTGRICPENLNIYEIFLEDYTGNGVPDKQLLSCITQKDGYEHKNYSNIKLQEQQFEDIELVIKQELEKRTIPKHKISYDYTKDFNKNVIPFIRPT